MDDLVVDAKKLAQHGSCTSGGLVILEENPLWTLRRSILMKLFERLKNPADPKKRCMVCKYWKPETEATGRCMLGNPPIYKHPNYVCERFEPDC